MKKNHKLQMKWFVVIGMILVAAALVRAETSIVLHPDTTYIDMLGILNMTGRKIVSMADPGSAQDAATKAYVDNYVVGGSSGSGWSNSSGLVYLTTGTDEVNMTTLYVNNSNSYVGIGTNNPSASLYISGNLSLALGTDITEFSIDGTLGGNSDDALPTEKAVKTYVDGQVGGGSLGSGWTNTSGQVALTTATDNVSAGTFFVDNTNSEVGIGTTSPGTYLHVNRADAVYGAPNATYTTTMGYSTVAFGNSISGTKLMVGLGSGSYMWLQAQNTDNGLKQIVINPAGGNVGIGTTGPNALLDVGGGAAGHIDGTDDLLVKDDVEIDGALYVDGVITGDGSGITNIGSGAITDNWINESGDTTGALAKDLNIDADTFVISYDDNRVGIGTAGPGAEFHLSGDFLHEGPGISGTGQHSNPVFQVVKGDSGISSPTQSIAIFEDDGDALIEVRAPTSNYAGITIGDTQNNGIRILGYGGSHATLANGLGFFIDGAATPNMFIKSDGNVGIGTTGPTKKLEVSNSTQGITFDPTASTPTINSTSGEDLIITAATGNVIILIG